MSDSNVYTAERILSKRIHNGVTQYFIKWKGYSRRESTWEPVENILDPSLLTVFEQKKNKKTKKQKHNSSAAVPDPSPRTATPVASSTLADTTIASSSSPSSPPRPPSTTPRSLSSPSKLDLKSTDTSTSSETTPVLEIALNTSNSSSPSTLPTGTGSPFPEGSPTAVRTSTPQTQIIPSPSVPVKSPNQIASLSVTHSPKQLSSPTTRVPTNSSVIDVASSSFARASTNVSTIATSTSPELKPVEELKEEPKKKKQKLLKSAAQTSTLNQEPQQRLKQEHQQQQQQQQQPHSNQQHQQDALEAESNNSSLDHSIKSRHVTSKFAVMNTVITDVTVNDQTITISESKTNQGFFKEVHRNSVAVDTVN